MNSTSVISCGDNDHNHCSTTDNSHQTSQEKIRLLQTFTGLNLVGHSPVFVDTLQLIQKIAQCHAPVLIRGETGTGKENAARAMHYLSERRECGFIPLNCAAIPDELFESELFGHEKGAFTDAKSSQAGLVTLADGGTLFLDEVDSLTPKAQAALLRFLQTREYRPLGGRDTRQADVRILAATNADLSQRVEEKLFREDLFYRLNVLTVFMPSLRARKDDIPLIARALLHKFSEEYRAAPKQLSGQFIHYLMQQSWPGNVRELENTLLRAFLLSPETLLTSPAGMPPGGALFETVLEKKSGLTKHAAVEDNSALTGKSPESAAHKAEHMFHSINPQLSFQDAKAEVITQFEEQYLKQVLSIAEGNVSAAARIAGKERRALGKLIRKYRIDKSLYQSVPVF
ncbi:MAG TPA: sigma-54 dependent transcriptional regulator [Cellvibrio sp.]|nr:sigma-54 dependent transcriptional regulator [Cellvibrio sp.]